MGNSHHYAIASSAHSDRCWRSGCRGSWYCWNAATASAGIAALISSRSTCEECSVCGTIHCVFPHPVPVEMFKPATRPCICVRLSLHLQLQIPPVFVAQKSTQRQRLIALTRRPRLRWRPPPAGDKHAVIVCVDFLRGAVIAQPTSSVRPIKSFEHPVAGAHVIAWSWVRPTFAWVTQYAPGLPSTARADHEVVDQGTSATLLAVRHGGWRSSSSRNAYA